MKILVILLLSVFNLYSLTTTNYLYYNSRTIKYQVSYDHYNNTGKTFHAIVTRKINNSKYKYVTNSAKQENAISLQDWDGRVRKGLTNNFGFADYDGSWGASQWYYDDWYSPVYGGGGFDNRGLCRWWYFYPGTGGGVHWVIPTSDSSPYFNLSQYQYVDFYIFPDSIQSNQIFALEAWDFANSKIKQYFNTGPAYSWQRIRLPISGFAGTSLKSNTALTFVVGSGTGKDSGSGAGWASQVWFDQITLVTTNNLFPNVQIWTQEYTTNTNPSFAFVSANFSKTQPVASNIKWIRWKTPSLTNNTAGKFIYTIKRR